jgi:hypothetical protein
MAQLGERRVRIAKVGGSNPPISTKVKGNDITLFSLDYLPQFLALQILASFSGNLINFLFCCSDEARWATIQPITC